MADNHKIVTLSKEEIGEILTALSTYRHECQETVSWCMTERKDSAAHKVWSDRLLLVDAIVEKFET